MALQPATVQDLWAHASELAERAITEHDHPALRRALVTIAVAGSGGDPDAYRAVVDRVFAAARKLALDPHPLFDAAAALVAEDDAAAREAIVLAPDRAPVRAPGAGTPYGQFRGS